MFSNGVQSGKQSNVKWWKILNVGKFYGMSGKKSLAKPGKIPHSRNNKATGHSTRCYEQALNTKLCLAAV